MEVTVRRITSSFNLVRYLGECTEEKKLGVTAL